MSVPEEFVEADVPGVSTFELAERFGVCDKTINRWRKQLGRPRHRETRLTPEERARARALLEEGCPFSEVAVTLGRNAHHLRRLFPEFVGGWTPREVFLLRRALDELEAA